jgi:hypothetical protein
MENEKLATVVMDQIQPKASQRWMVSGQVQTKPLRNKYSLEVLDELINRIEATRASSTHSRYSLVSQQVSPQGSPIQHHTKSSPSSSLSLSLTPMVVAR